MDVGALYFIMLLHRFGDSIRYQLELAFRTRFQNEAVFLFSQKIFVEHFIFYRIS